jgi:hypothetical protein
MALAAVAASLAAPVAALTPLPEICAEPDGHTTTLLRGRGERFILIYRNVDGHETALVDCGGTAEVRAIQNDDSKMGTYDVFHFAMDSTRRFTMNDIAQMLRDEGHSATVVKVDQRSCMCEAPGQ